VQSEVSKPRQFSIWNPEEECLPRDELRALQLRRLRETVERVYHRVPFYREALDSRGVQPEQIHSLDDIRRLPFTFKDDLRANYPLGLLAVSREEVIRYHASSGTTGKPTVVAYTRRDLETWADLVARFCVSAGVRADDVVQIVFGYGLFTGGFGLHYGMERVGAAIIPASAGNTQRQLLLMRDLQSTVLVGTPSYALHLAEAMRESGYDRSAYKLRLGLFGGEFWSEGIREQIEANLGISATDNYGLSEVIGPGVSGDCQLKCGMHLFEDHFLWELIDPQTEEPVAPGQKGELVLTSLTKEALPVLRYRTRDICAVDPEPCPCGRTFWRMSKVSGRTDDMLIIRGANIFPSQIEDVLMRIEGAAPHYQLVVRKRGYLDDLEVRVEVSQGLLFDQMKEMQRLKEEITQRVREVVGVSVKITLVEPKSIERSVGKAQRVVDLRRA